MLDLFSADGNHGVQGGISIHGYLMRLTRYQTRAAFLAPGNASVSRTSLEFLWPLAAATQKDR